MRLVLDTNIVVSGMLWNGAPAHLLERVVQDEVLVFTNDVLLVELTATLGKPKLAERIASAGKSQNDLVATYRHLCTVVTPSPLPAIAPDPDDDWVIATALAARGDLIVTGDKLLLTAKPTGALRIVTVRQAMAVLSAQSVS